MLDTLIKMISLFMEPISSARPGCCSCSPLLGSLHQQEEHYRPCPGPDSQYQALKRRQDKMEQVQSFRRNVFWQAAGITEHVLCSWHPCDPIMTPFDPAFSHFSGHTGKIDCGHVSWMFELNIFRYLSVYVSKAWFDGWVRLGWASVGPTCLFI